MTYRDQREVVELELDAATTRSLDRVARLSEGKLDRSSAARLALEQGLGGLLREAEQYAAQHLTSCPRCGTAGMFPARAGELLLQGCGACGGVWMDDASSRRLVAQPSERAAELASLAAKNAKQPVSAEGPLLCPVCDEALGHHDFPNAHLRLDVCDAHGTWFDRGELALLIALIREEHRKQSELQQAIRSASIDAEVRQVKEIYASGYSEGHARASRFRR